MTYNVFGWTLNPAVVVSFSAQTRYNDGVVRMCATKVAENGGTTPFFVFAFYNLSCPFRGRCLLLNLQQNECVGSVDLLST